MIISGQVIRQMVWVELSNYARHMMFYLSLGSTKNKRLSSYCELFRLHFGEAELESIRRATNTGMAIGSDRFKEEIAELTGRRVTLLKPGPKPKNMG